MKVHFFFFKDRAIDECWHLSLFECYRRLFGGTTLCFVQTIVLFCSSKTFACKMFAMKGIYLWASMSKVFQFVLFSGKQYLALFARFLQHYGDSHSSYSRNPRHSPFIFFDCDNVRNAKQFSSIGKLQYLYLWWWQIFGYFEISCSIFARICYMLSQSFFKIGPRYLYVITRSICSLLTIRFPASFSLLLTTIHMDFSDINLMSISPL